MRVTTILEMIGIEFSPSHFALTFLFTQSYSDGLEELVAVPNPDWTAAVVDKALELINAKTESVGSIG